MKTPLKVTDGVYQLSGAVNIFLIDDGDVTIIDCGLPGATKTVLAALKHLGKQPSDVKHILITHADLDHVGSAASLVKATGAKVYAGAETAAFLRDKVSPPHGPRIMQLLLKFIHPLLAKQVTVDHIFSDGDTLDIAGGIQVIAVPGHTSDNFAFYWPREHVLFAPDLLQTQNKGVLGITQARMSHDMKAARESARKVLNMDAAYICVGHGHFLEVSDAPHQVENLKKVLD